MGFLDQVKAVWPLVTQAPWGFAPVFLAVLVFGWAAGRFMYNERVTTLKERIEAYKDKLDGATPDEARAKIAALEQRLDELADPRLFTKNQLDKLAASLHGVTGAVVISRDSASVESAGVYSQIRAFFKQRGWTVTGGAVWGMDDPPDCGLAIIVRTGDTFSKEEAAITAAFDAAGITYVRVREEEDAAKPALQINFTDRA